MRAVPRRLVPRLAGGLIAVALTAAGLTGCAGAGGGGCTPEASSGQAAQAVSASGTPKPTVRFPTPQHSSSTQVTTIRPGTGDPIRASQEIVADFTIMNATTGKVITTTPYTTTAKAATFVVDAVPVKGLRKALVCSRVGERLAAVIPPSEGYAAANRPSNLGAGDSIVVVADIRRAYLARANGVNQVMAGGLPAVVLAPDGRPGITVPKTTPPKKLVVANLKKGSGAVLKASDTAVVHYTGVLWNTGKVFDSSWQSGTPAAIPLSQVVKGFRTALVGQRVGSQVLAILPPSEGYGKAGQGQIPANSTLVFVIDILGKA
jgi:FKBP-type peptidyl-prolyl cis-trans isomerase